MHDHLSPHLIALAHHQKDEQRLRLTQICPECRKAAESFDAWTLMADHPDPRVAGEIDLAFGRLRELRKLSLELALHLVEIDDDFHSWGLARLAILNAQRILGDRPGEGRVRTAYELSLLAVHIASELDWEFYGGENWARLEKQALSTLLDSLRAFEGPARLDGLMDRLFDLLLEISIGSVEDLQPEPTPGQLSTEPRLKLPVESMAGLLTPNELRIFEIVEDLGCPTAHDVILAFHDRHAPLEPANVIMILRRLVDRSLLKAAAGPAPSTAPVDEYLYFEVLDVPVSEHVTSGSMDLELAISLVEKTLQWVRRGMPDLGKGT